MLESFVDVLDCADKYDLKDKGRFRIFVFSLNNFVAICNDKKFDCFTI